MGFVAALDGYKLHCIRGSFTNGRKLKRSVPLRTHARTWKCGCPWEIRFRNKCKQTTNSTLIITKVFPNHAFPCEPGHNQLRLGRLVSGQYTQYTDLIMKDLINMICTDKYVRTQVIREKLLKIYPRSIYPSYTAVYNASLRAQMIIDKAQMNDEDPSTLLTRKDFPNLYRGLDDETGDVLDDAIVASSTIFKNVLNSCDGNNQLVNFLYQLSSIDVGFTYKIFFDQRNKISGFMWQISVMRGNFERFGSCMMLDAMKKATNTHLCHYIAPVVRNEFNNPMVVCECLIAAERGDAYIAILKALAEMSPGRSKEDVCAIFVDEFLKTEFLTSAGYINARLFYDHIHLKDK